LILLGALLVLCWFRGCGLEAVVLFAVGWTWNWKADHD